MPWVELVPTTETRTCEKCKAYTWWARPRQRTKGICLDCAGMKFLSEMELYDVVENLLDFFPGSALISPARPTLAELGPCALCRTTTRLYGLHGQPLCPACRSVTP
jgi:hypothetical protein